MLVDLSRGTPAAGVAVEEEAKEAKEAAVADEEARAENACATELKELKKKPTEKWQKPQSKCATLRQK